MKKPSLAFYPKQLKLNTQVTQIGHIEEETFEIVDLIHAFHSADDFASWMTQQTFSSIIYENKVKEGKYIREWQYSFEKKSFFFGKVEFEEEEISPELKEQFLNKNSIFIGAEQSVGIEKTGIHAILAEPYYTVISHAIYTESVIGTVWEIYNLPTLLKIYEKREDPLRYWRTTRRE